MSLSLRESASVIVMPSESSFKQHVEQARSALKTFNAIRQLDAPGPVKTAFDELVTITADFNKFVPYFVNHSAFQELPPSVYSTLEDFLSKHPNFEKPANYSRLVGLNARSLDSPVKKGEYSLRTQEHFLTSLAAVLSTANLRPEKIKRITKVKFRSILFLWYLRFIFLGKTCPTL